MILVLPPFRLIGSVALKRKRASEQVIPRGYRLNNEPLIGSGICRVTTTVILERIVVWTIMRDVEYDADAETPYECFNCGTIVLSDVPPQTCPDCGSEMRNRMTPIE